MSVEYVAQKFPTKNVQLNTVLGDYKRKINEIIDNLGVGGGSGGATDHSELTGVTSSQHHTENHEARHRSEGGDPLSHDLLADFLAGEHFLQSAITTVGIIDTGIWQGTPVANAYLAGIDQNLLQASTPLFAGLSLGGDLRFYDNGNYVGFEAPALSADQLWTLWDEDGLANDVVGTDGAGNLIWITGTSLGNVIAVSNFGTDNVLLRSDGTGKGVQHSGIVINDSDYMTGIGRMTIKHIAPIFRFWETDGSVDENWQFQMVNGSLRLQTNNDAFNFASNKIIFYQSGKMLVGSAVGTPSEKFDVRGNTASTYIASFEQDSPTGWGVLIETDSVEPGDPAFRIDNNVGRIFNFSSSGNFKLDSATSKITGGTILYIEAGGSGVCSQTIYDDTTVAGSSVQILTSPSYQLKRDSSSRRYKTNIKDLELDPSLIYKIRTVSFNSLCKGDDKKRRYHGLLAEDVEKIYPGIIEYNKDHEAENYNNRMLTTLMLAEEQKLYQRIITLEGRVKQLEN